MKHAIRTHRLDQEEERTASAIIVEHMEPLLVDVGGGTNDGVNGDAMGGLSESGAPVKPDVVAGVGIAAGVGGDGANTVGDVTATGADAGGGDGANTVGGGVYAEDLLLLEMLLECGQ